MLDSALPVVHTGVMETTTTTTKQVRDLEVGDVVLGIGTVAFTEPHTVTRRSAAAVYATGGAFWPLPIVGHGIAVVA